jgi:hypothetical protein
MDANLQFAPEHRNFSMRETGLSLPATQQSRNWVLDRNQNHYSVLIPAQKAKNRTSAAMNIKYLEFPPRCQSIGQTYREIG